MAYRDTGRPNRWKTQFTCYGGSGNPNWRGHNVLCANCGMTIRRPPSKLLNNDLNYCSQKCYHSLNKRKQIDVIPRAEMKGAKHPRWMGNIYCKYCDAELHDRLKRKARHCGSIECRIEAVNRANQIKSKKLSGIKNPNWQGGPKDSPYPIEFNKRLKRIIKDRDGRECAICKGHHKLSAHHIDYDKSNSSVMNFVTLCSYCHSTTNGNRQYWKEFFQNAMWG